MASTLYCSRWHLMNSYASRTRPLLNPVDSGIAPAISECYGVHQILELVS